MEFNLNKFKDDLKQQNAHDALRYFESLREILTYMNISYELLDKVYSQRIIKLNEKEKEICQRIKNSSYVRIDENNLNCTDLDIAGLTINDGLFLRKTIIEFFHYARISSDILFQIINAAIFNNSSFANDDRSLIKNVTDQISKNSNLATLKSLLYTNKNDSTFKYIQAFDNYMKHIKTIDFTIKDRFMFGNNNEFIIHGFNINGNTYPQQNAIDIAKKVNDYTMDTAKKILEEVHNQLPNCANNS